MPAACPDSFLAPRALFQSIVMASPQPRLSFVRSVAEGIELRLKVIPGASRSMIVGVLGDRLKVKVAAPPEDGKVNKAVIALISEWLGADTVEIVSGHAHPEKVVRVLPM